MKNLNYSREYEPLLGYGKSEVDRGGYRNTTADKITDAGPGAAPISGHRAGFGRGGTQPQ